MPTRLPRWEVVLRVLVLVALGALYVWWALNIPYEPFVDTPPANLKLAPDEGMRIELLEWIVDHGCLPLGTEPELADTVWGFSYGITVYGSTLAAFPLAWLLSACGLGTTGIVLAARLTDVAFAVAALALLFRISDRLLSHASARFLFVLLLGLLPQFGFIASYFNCEAMGLFCVALSTLMLVRGAERGWRWCDAICLGIALGVTGLSYYFAYGIYPVSVLVYYVTCVRARRDAGTFSPLRDLLLKPLAIVGVAFALCGWFFIRNLILHGDFFGNAFILEMSEEHAVDRLKPSNRMLAKDLGVSPLGMLLGEGGDESLPWVALPWVQTSAWSTVGVFGWMAFPLGRLEYAVYFLILGVGFALGVLRLVACGVTGRDRLPFHWLVVASVALMIIFTVGFSLAYSWGGDYQPQGRYIMACVPFILFVVALGYGGGRFPRRPRERAAHFATGGIAADGASAGSPGFIERASSVAAIAVMALWILLFAWVFLTFIVPATTAPLFG